jgi:hypothetical protein
MTLIDLAQYLMKLTKQKRAQKLNNDVQEDQIAGSHMNSIKVKQFICTNVSNFFGTPKNDKK